MAANSLKGTKRGKSKSARNYQKNSASRKKKAEYDKAFNAKPEQRKKRAELNKANRNSKASKKGDGKDMSHTKNGLRLKSQSKNRGSKTDTAGDRRARGGKRTTRKKK